MLFKNPSPVAYCSKPSAETVLVYTSTPELGNVHSTFHSGSIVKKSTKLTWELNTQSFSLGSLPDLDTYCIPSGHMVNKYELCTVAQALC